VLLVLISLSMLPSTVVGHPDILAQIEELDRQLVEHPGDARLLVKRGDLNRRHQDYEAAQIDFTKARRADPGYPELDFFEGRLLLESGDPQRAVELLGRYLATKPQHANAWLLRGEGWLALGQSDAAADDFVEAIKRSENPSPELFRRLALVLFDSGESRWQDADTVIATGLVSFPSDISLRALGVDIALARHDPNSAANYMKPLPPAVLQLPQWQDRSRKIQSLCATTDCLE